MAIRERKTKNGIVWEVYWRDPTTKKFKSKNFRNGGDAVTFNIMCKTELSKFRKRMSDKTKFDTYVFPERNITPLENNDLDKLRQKCMELYENPLNRVADIFDFIMEAMLLPVRFKDVFATIKSSKRDVVPAKLRFKILKRDNYRCKTCGATAAQARLHIDHIVPISRGGITEERNLQTLCEKCNLGKRDFPA